MATLINGNGNPRIYAAQDADLIAALAGDITGIAQIGNKFAATAVDANTISVADGVIVTKEGRRIQLDAGSTDMFVIPTGTTGVTNYYIIGYKLTTQSDDSQIAETFVQLMSSSSETITEDTFRSGATDVYVSLYRVQQNGVNLGTITGLLPELTNISELKSDLAVNNITTSMTSSTARDMFGYKSGHIVNWNGYFYIPSGSTFPLTIANLGEISRPVNDYIFTCPLTDGASLKGFDGISVKTDGRIVINEPTQYAYILFRGISYIAH